MSDLIQKLESAESGHWELDAEIATQLGENVHYHGGQIVERQRYTKSIDNARAMDDTPWGIITTEEDDGRITAQVRYIVANTVVKQGKATGNDPACTVCAAILRAHSHSPEGVESCYFSRLKFPKALLVTSP